MKAAGDDPRGGLSTLWGKGAANATRVRECLAMPGKRKQEILTPDEILSPLLELWGSIACDPCGSPLHEIADLTIYQHEDGLRYAWPDRTFVNPPYANLKSWLRHFVTHTTGRACLLGPVRSQRPWWRATAREVDVFFLKPVKFRGYSQAFPGPLCLMFRGHARADLARVLPPDLGDFIT